MLPSASHYANIDYLFWRKNDIEDYKLDKDSYPWIMLYIWKAINDKLFRRIDMDPLETVRHAESECHAWFEANMKQEEHTVTTTSNKIASSERCLIDGSWTQDAFFSSYGWTWKTSGETTQLLGAKNQQRRISPLHSELDALLWAMECML